MINAVEVERDENGFWTHPHFPNLGELWKPYKDWAEENNIKFANVWFECDASEELEERFYEKEDGSAITEWQPTKPADNAFLLSIHDTEDGPVAIWALPTTQTVN
ncbi:hypothetical protein A6E13_16415 [Aliivibrio fischeri]|uniref:hypothetical protein n=1 Tax=Aliivibrio fischeri TaxID=668 RepID=UPI00080E04D4|nr:hypothetical protein [Aliivibrio fischeri]OCH31806.1 hypothetical protein A6E13_16415 [Aliivibrio fischeri]